MNKLILSLVVGSAMALTAVSAHAFPAAPSASTQVPSDVIQVAGGCGPGWHRGPRGGCRPNRGPVVVVAPRRAVVVGPRCVTRVGAAGRVVRVCR